MEDTEILIVFLLIVWIAIGCIVGSFGSSRKIGFAKAFYASFFLSPLLAMLFVLASDKKINVGLSSGEKIALFVPLGLILFLVGFGIYGSIQFNIEYAKKCETEKRINDSLSVIHQAEFSRIYKYEAPITEPENGFYVKYNTNKSISLFDVYEPIIPASQIPTLIKLIDRAEKMSHYCDSINSVDVKKLLGNVNGYNFYFTREDYGGDKITYGDMGSISIEDFRKYLTIDRDDYYKQLKAYQEKKKKDEELLSKL